MGSGTIWIAQEAYDQALNLIHACRSQAKTLDAVGYLHMFNHLRADLYLRMGRLARVADWLDEAGLPESPCRTPPVKMIFT